MSFQLILPSRLSLVFPVWGLFSAMERKKQDIELLPCAQCSVSWDAALDF